MVSKIYSCTLSLEGNVSSHSNQTITSSLGAAFYASMNGNLFDLRLETRFDGFKRVGSNFDEGAILAEFSLITSTFGIDRHFGPGSPAFQFFTISRSRKRFLNNYTNSFQLAVPLVILSAVKFKVFKVV
jgi:hypothetical protein